MKAWNALTDTQRVDRIIGIGIACNILLAAAKLCAGRLGHSEAVFADGIESLCDLGVGLVALVGARISNRPMDTCHPYGHGKAESLLASLTGLVILATGAAIAVQAIHTAAANTIPAPQPIAVAVAALTIAIKELLARTTYRVAHQTQSPLVAAQAADHRKDALTSIATLLGVGAATLGFPRLDPLAAGLSALMILKVGFDCFGQAWNELMDKSIDPSQLDTITQLARQIPGVEHVHEIKGRKSGRYAIIDLKLEMDPDMTVRNAHAIADQVKQTIFDACPHVGDVMIHINPHDDGNHRDLTRL